MLFLFTFKLKSLRKNEKRLWIPVLSIVTAAGLTACLKKGDDVPVCTSNSLTADRQSIDSFIAENDISYLTYISDGYYRGLPIPEAEVPQLPILLWSLSAP
ncbi:hypothetical protein KRR40_05870 [Niabella defluvii]|nr:hypothetical protein KRR40_05870 [Niabella sp. I65]